MQLTLENINWQNFTLRNLFPKLETGKSKGLNHLKKNIDGISYLGATNLNNAVLDFVEPIPELIQKGNCIAFIRNGEGSMGYAVYKNEDFIATSDITVGYNEHLNRYTGMFITTVADRIRGKYNFGYKRSAQRLAKEILTLPATADNQPDWDFMEAYMRQQEQSILQPTIQHLCKQLIYSELAGGGKIHLSNLNWKEFVFGKEFYISATGSGIDKNKLIQGEGETPYITRTDTNNGIDGFVPKQSSKFKIDEGNLITIGLDTQTVFYQPTAFYTGQNIQVIRHPQLDKHNAMFLVVAIQKLVERFSWGSYGATLTRLRKSRIFLPADKEGNIDFAFMSSFMKELESDILNTTLKYFGTRSQFIVNQQFTPPHTNNGIKFIPFAIRDIFTIENCKCSKVSGIGRGNVPYIGATNNNNGIMKFIERREALMTKGNCIVFICDGEGSIGLSVYKHEDFIGTTTVKVGRCPQLNRYTGMFITTVADTVRGKYNFGYKRNEKNLKKETIMLPATPDNQPDWQYMESYMRTLEAQQIIHYLRHIAAKQSAKIADIY